MGAPRDVCAEARPGADRKRRQTAYAMWNHYVAERQGIAAGDAACARCEPPRALRDRRARSARSAGPRKPRSKSGRASGRLCGRTGGRREKEDKALYYMWRDYVLGRQVSRGDAACPERAAAGAARRGARGRGSGTRKPRRKSGRASRRLHGRTSGCRQKKKTDALPCGGATSQNAPISRGRRGVRREPLRALRDAERAERKEREREADAEREREADAEREREAEPKRQRVQ